MVAHFIQNIQDTSVLEIIAVIFGLLSVWFAKKENILVYPTGIISVLIYVYICIDPKVKLYADAGINLFYFFMSVYGWYQWGRKNENATLQISKCTRKNWFWSLTMFAASFIFIYFLLRWFKADDLSYWQTRIPLIDTFTTSVFIVAMLLMAYKKLENWLFWIIGDIISVPLYAYKGLVFTSLQFFIFLILAVLGYMEWRKKLIQYE